MLHMDKTKSKSQTKCLFVTFSILLPYYPPLLGGHINPAVTFALMLTGDTSVKTGLLYFIAQFLGATLGAAILWGCTASQLLMETTAGDDGTTSPPFLLGSNFVNPAVPLGSAFLLEVMGTFLLVWTVLNTAVSKNSIAANLAPMAIGFSVFLAHIVLIPFTGCGINPARTFGPHIVILMAGETVGKAGWWIYYTAPFVGAAAAALICKVFLHLKSSDAAAADAKKAVAVTEQPLESKKQEAEEEFTENA
jgi:MIP family channel proteins